MNTLIERLISCYYIGIYWKNKKIYLHLFKLASKNTLQMDPVGGQGEGGTWGRQLQDFEPVLQRKERLTLSHSWWSGSVQEERWGKDITQTQPHHTTTIVPDRGAFQITRPDGPPGDRQSTTKDTSQVWLARNEKSLREMGECLPGMSPGKRPKEDEVSPQGPLRAQSSMKWCR